MTAGLTPFLAGRDVLLVEDETMVSFVVEDMLAALGAGSVRHAARLEKAQALIADKLPALAVLDVNVAGELVFPVAERLTQASVPFLFITGYGRGGVEGSWAACEVLQKPFTPAAFEAALRNVLGTAESKS